MDKLVTFQEVLKTDARCKLVHPMFSVNDYEDLGYILRTLSTNFTDEAIKKILSDGQWYVDDKIFPIWDVITTITTQKAPIEVYEAWSNVLKAEGLSKKNLGRIGEEQCCDVHDYLMQLLTDYENDYFEIILDKRDATEAQNNLTDVLTVLTWESSR